MGPSRGHPSQGGAGRSAHTMQLQRIGLSSCMPLLPVGQAPEGVQWQASLCQSCCPALVGRSERVVGSGGAACYANTCSMRKSCKDGRAQTHIAMC